MGLAAVFRSAFEAANAASLDAQVDVTLEAWIGQDALGAPQSGNPSGYADPVPLKALVTMNPTILRGAQAGQEQQLLAIVTFLVPIPPNGAEGRKEPIDPRDRITLQDGSTGPIVSRPGGMSDSATGLPFASTVRLGRGL